MMCYRDRTYCIGPCATTDCSRQVTEGVEVAAARAGLNLALSDFRATCPDYIAPGGSETKGADR